MEQSNIRAVFNKTFKGQPNFMTPNVISYGQRNGFLYELSRGRGISGGTMYAVTVLTRHGERTEYNKGGFESEALAMEHVSTIGREA